MDPVQKSFSLLLSHEYTVKSIEDLGYKALKGVDNARFCALEEANALVPVEKKLRFFIVKLSQEVNNRLNENGWKNWVCNETVHWYGTSFGYLVTDTLNNFMPQLTFLNPAHETFLEFWKTFGTTADIYTGNEGVLRITKYLRFAVVVCPAADYIVAALCFLRPEIAAELLLSYRRGDIALIQLLFVATSKKKLRSWTFYTLYPAKTCLRFSKAVCDLLLDTNDSKLVAQFFTDYCARLGYLEGNKALLPNLTKMIRKFDWRIIGEGVLQALGDTETMLETVYLDDDAGFDVIKVGGFGNDSSAELLLQLADGLYDGEAKRSIVKAAVKNGLDVHSTAVAQTLWEYATTHTEIIEAVVDKLHMKEPNELVPFTRCFSHCIAELDETSETCVKLRAIALKRCQWLREEIQRLEMPFTWEMPYAKGPNDEFLEFLRGPDETMTRKIDVFIFPECFVKECLERGGPWNASVSVETYKIQESIVRITKTRKWFEDEQAKIPEYKSEPELLKVIDKF